MASRTIQVVGPENFGVTVHTITDKMNERFNEIKRNNPRGFMDQFEQQFELICWEIAQEHNGQFDRREVDGEEQLLFCYQISIEEAYKMIERVAA